MDFKPEYVRCIWSPELEGEKVLFSDEIDRLRLEVNKGEALRMRCEKGSSINLPFKCGDAEWRFVYYDPFFDLKLAHEQGKTIQVLQDNIWMDWYNPQWEAGWSYRIKPEKETPVTHRELSLWMAHGNGELYYCIDEDRRAKYFTGFQRYPDVILRPPTCFTEFPYHYDEGDKPVCNVMVRKWEDTEWHTPTREYMGLEE